MADTPTPVRTPEPVKAKKPENEWWMVKLTHPLHSKRIVFRSMSERRAKAWVEGHYPRGSEAYLESPSGETTHYEAERTGERGGDVEAWLPFDPAEWSPPEQSPPPGQDEWADKEG
jgi:hypothetical protein